MRLFNVFELIARIVEASIAIIAKVLWDSGVDRHVVVEAFFSLEALSTLGALNTEKKGFLKKVTSTYSRYLLERGVHQNEFSCEDANICR